MQINPKKIRMHVLNMVYSKKSGHIGGSFSIAELISYLYSTYNLASSDIDSDKLILSKGHAVPAIYAALYELGKIKEEDLANFREIDSPLQGHPDKCRLPLMHATTGSLGQGLSIAIGHALAAKMQNKKFKVFCILGDGEIQEGQVWESFMFAPKYELSNLIAFVDLNGGQNDGYVSDTLNIGEVKNKIKTFGWNVINIDGHSIKSIDGAMNRLSNTKPNCILLRTVKGKGVSFMEHPEWHSRVPTEDEYKKALEEITNG